jgi:membrane associated rhomboid family serine protease
MTVSLLIIILTCLISYKAFQSPSAFQQLKHYPYQEARTKEWYRFLSSGFVHGSWTHLIINMYVLYMFGPIIEKLFVIHFGVLYGRILFILVYLTTIIVADIPSYLKHRNNPQFAAIGASGAVSGIIFIYILYFPFEKLYFLFFPFVGFYSIILGIAYLVYSSWASKNARDNIDHSAHFYGAIYGILVMIMLRPSVLNIFFQQIMDKIS